MIMISSKMVAKHDLGRDIICSHGPSAKVEVRCLPSFTSTIGFFDNPWGLGSMMYARLAKNILECLGSGIH